MLDPGSHDLGPAEGPLPGPSTDTNTSAPYAPAPDLMLQGEVPANTAPGAGAAYFGSYWPHPTYAITTQSNQYTYSLPYASAVQSYKAFTPKWQPTVTPTGGQDTVKYQPAPYLSSKHRPAETPSTSVASSSSSSVTPTPALPQPTSSTPASSTTLVPVPTPLASTLTQVASLASTGYQNTAEILTAMAAMDPANLQELLNKNPALRTWVLNLPVIANAHVTGAAPATVSNATASSTEQSS
jgi:hypothetical protein